MPRYTVTVTDAEAKAIARSWAPREEVNCVARFAETGEIHPGRFGTAWLVRVLIESHAAVTVREDDDLHGLLAYVAFHGERGPVDGWSEL